MPYRSANLGKGCGGPASCNLATTDDWRRGGEPCGGSLGLRLAAPESEFTMVPCVLFARFHGRTGGADLGGTSLASNAGLGTLGKGGEEQVALALAEDAIHPPHLL